MNQSIKKPKYWVVVKGNRFKQGLYNYFSGMVDVHPFDYIEALKIQNQAKKGYDRTFTTFILMSWQKVTEAEWKKYDKDRMISVINDNSKLEASDT